MLDEVQGRAGVDVGHVQFFDVGAFVRGAFQCADCGYGIALRAHLPRCPMCDGTTWERGLGGYGAGSRLRRLDD